MDNGDFRQLCVGVKMKRAIIIGIAVFLATFISVKTHAAVQTVWVCDQNMNCQWVTIYTQDAQQPLPPPPVILGAP